MLVIKALVVGVDLGGQFQFHAGGAGDLDGAVRPLVARHAAQKSEIGPLGPRRSGLIQVERQPVINRGGPIGVGQRPALAVRDRDQGKLRPARVSARQIGVIEPSMRRRHHLGRNVLEQREMNEMAEMNMDDVELGGAAAHLLQHRQMGRRRRDQAGRVAAQGAFAHRHQPRAGLRIGAGEQGDLMAPAHQLLGQEGDDPFRTAISRRRHRFEQGRNLSNSHSKAIPIKGLHHP